jgi:hypothetical protein
MFVRRTVRTGVVSLVCLSLVLSGVVVAADVEPNDDSDAASPLVVGEPVRGSISNGDGDYADWYLFEVDEPGEISATMSYDQDDQFIVRVYRPDGLVARQQVIDPGTTTIAASAPEAGTYRVQVFYGDGDYELLVEFAGESENDSAATGDSADTGGSSDSTAGGSAASTGSDGDDGDTTTGNGDASSTTGGVALDAADDFAALSPVRIGPPAGATAFVDGTAAGGGVAPHVEWYSVFPEEEELYSVAGIERTSDGYLLAASQRTAAEGGTDSFDIWVVNVDDDGTVQWRSVYRTDADELTNGLVATDDGGALVYGRVRTGDSWQSLAVKVDSTGTVAWTVRPGDVGTSVLDATPTDDGVLLVGDGDVSSDSRGAVWASAVASDGTVQWERTYDVPGLARSVVAVPDGYVLAGTVDATGDDRDIVVAKLTPDGDLQWSRGYGVRGEGYDDTATAVVALPDGDVVLGGTLFQPGPDGSPFGPTDGMLLRIDPANGDLRWARTYGGIDTDYVEDVLPYEDGVVVVGTRSVDPGENEIAQRVGASVGWVAAIDGDGNARWMTMVTEPTDGITPIVDFRAGVVADEGFVVAGSTNFDLRVTRIGWDDVAGPTDSGLQAVSPLDAQSGDVASIGGSGSDGAGATSTSFPGFGPLAVVAALVLVALGVHVRRRA